MMNADGSIEEQARRLFAKIDIHNCNYDDLGRITAEWIELAGNSFSTAWPFSRLQLDRIKNLIARRRINSWRKRLRPRSLLENALAELFLLSRIRSYVSAYLSVQEGEDFEGVDRYDTPVPQFIASLLRNLGKQPYATINLGGRHFRFIWGVDPLVHLRKMYGLELLQRRRSGRKPLFAKLGMVFHRTAFSLKTKLMSIILRIGLRKLIRSPSRFKTASWVASPYMRRLMEVAVFHLFPSAGELTTQESNELQSKLVAYFKPRISGLSQAISRDSVFNHGLIKLCKVAFGVLVHRVAAKKNHQEDHPTFIFNTLRLAFSWGVTYPLVDNVLDSGQTSNADREMLTRILSDLFGEKHVVQTPTKTVDHVCPSIREVHSCLSEMLSLVPAQHIPQTLRVLGLLLESHRRDATRRLSTLHDNSPEVFKDVMVDTALKSALVRMATMEVCGITITNKTFAQSVVRSLFNQLGDDLWDIYEDFDAGRVTPFTQYLTKGGGKNPFQFYLLYSTLISQEMSRRRQTATFLGFCETLRDSLLTLKSQGDDPLGVSKAIANMLEIVANPPAMKWVRVVPHVDFDAVLFAFENAIFDLLPEANR
ncbi:hypothetical protein [Zavarzinella formosa]|uniref:hypothetical protein n=1 Tax=Zavarzinella formosa TaxID=360055 RepID=UPI0002F2BEC8|nr:hypothetical protein [Zavarzinella formosa]